MSLTWPLKTTFTKDITFPKGPLWSTILGMNPHFHRKICETFHLWGIDWYRAMLYNKDDYPDPSVFKPERFIKDGQLDPFWRRYWRVKIFSLLLLIIFLWWLHPEPGAPQAHLKKTEPWGSGSGSEYVCTGPQGAVQVRPKRAEPEPNRTVASLHQWNCP